MSNNVKPGSNFVVLDLDAASWYIVRITAHNSAGFTVAEYEFATLTVTGGMYKVFSIQSASYDNHFQKSLNVLDPFTYTGIHM